MTGPISTIRPRARPCRSAAATCRGGIQGGRNNFGPRAGFAWTLDDLERWVVRGGYGVYYNQGALATSEGLYFNPPYFNLNVYFPIPGLPPLTVQNPFPPNFPVSIPQSATAYQPISGRRGSNTGTSASSIRSAGAAESKSPMSRRAATT